MRRLKKLFENKRFSARKFYNYQKKDSLMTDAERVFFLILKEIIGEQYEIFAQVHLSSILDHKIKGQYWKSAFSHIHQKSFDFVVCENESLRPVLAIELNDKSHDRPIRIKRDKIVHDICSHAGIPLIFVKYQEDYNLPELKDLIASKLTETGLTFTTKVPPNTL